MKTAFLVAGTASGVGKTTVCCALIAAMRRRGLVVQPFKGGPDFLDTTHHTRLAGRPSRNLDSWLLSAEANGQVFARGMVDADAGVVEGMMGLFDGKSGTGAAGSSAEIAQMLELPVVLVVDASKTARSIAATVLGFELFDPALKLAGVILNRVAGPRHLDMLCQAIRLRCATPILGSLPRTPEISIPERHLGLHAADASSEPDQIAQDQGRLADLADAHFNMAAILALKATPPALAPRPPEQGRRPVRIGIARDTAFSFYYEDNLDLLREHGAELVAFSPLCDTSLPAGLDALYLGGGYPELHAEQLSRNAAMRREVREFAESGRAIYAECGGMIYLAESLQPVDADVERFALCGVLPIEVEMTPRLVDFGYVTATFTEDCLLGPKGTAVRGHSFHYSRVVGTPNLKSSYSLEYSLSKRCTEEGYTSGNVLASYLHLHFRGNASLVPHLLEAIAACRDRAGVEVLAG